MTNLAILAAFLLLALGCTVAPQPCGSINRPYADETCPCVTTAERVPSDYGTVACRPDQDGVLVGGGDALAITRGHVSGATASGGGAVLLCTCRGSALP